MEKDNYYLPAFQRDYVWDEDDVKSLIDSILRGYPIGAIILWKPSSKDFIKDDPFAVPLTDSVVDNGGDYYYVIDGQQRLTSLLLLFNGWRLPRNGREITLKVPISLYPTDKGGYRLYKSDKRGIDVSLLLRAFATYDMKTYNDLITRYSEEYIKKAEPVIKRILEYKVPVYIMSTTKEDPETVMEMAQAFIRINKEGVRIGNVELMLSLLAGKMGGLIRDTIYNDIYRKIREETFEIQIQPIIRLVLSNFGFAQSQISHVEKFASSLDRIAEYPEENLKPTLQKSAKAFKLAVDFVKNELPLPSAQLLPSQQTIVPLAKYFYTADIEDFENLSSEEIDRIKHWFILVNFVGYYSTSPDSKLEADLSVISESNGTFPYNELLRNIEQRKYPTRIRKDLFMRGLNVNVMKRSGRQYLFILYLLLAQENANDWAGHLITQVPYGSLAKHHIFPREFLDQNLVIDDPTDKEIMINNLGNITFIHKSTNSEIGDLPLHDEDARRYYAEERGYIYKIGLSENTLMSHFIPLDRELWKLENYEEFLSKRVELMYSALKKEYPGIIS
nr:DUF262 domain-containing protein [Thermococcus sp. JdF3]